MITAWLLTSLALANPHDDVDPTRYEQVLADADAPAWEKLAARAAFLESQAQASEALLLWAQVADDPEAGIRAIHARERVAFLESRRDLDGTLTGWERLQQARLEFEATGSDGARQRILGLLSAEGLAPVTSAEARLWLARDALIRRKDPQAAHDLARPLWEDRDQWPTWVGQRAGITYTKALARLGRWEEAIAIQEGFRVPAPGAPRPTPVDEVRRDLDLERRREIGWFVLGASTLGLLAPLARLRERPPIPWGLLPLGLALLVAWAIAEGWEQGAGAAVPDFAKGVLGLHVITAWSLHASRGIAPLIAAVRVVSVAATIALIWLVLDAHQQLEWMGW